MKSASRLLEFKASSGIRDAKMRTIKLPEPPSGNFGMPDIFDKGVSSVVRRAVIIGNGSPGAEHQCVGLVRALGLYNKYSLHRVNRPKGGVHNWLKWLPLSIHKKIDCIIKYIQFDLKYVAFSHLFGGKEEAQALKERTAASAIATYVSEADPKKIAAIAHESFDREGPLLVVASGRDTALVAAAVKRLASRDTFVVQIQHPRICLNDFDMVITPHHDYHVMTPAAYEEVPRFLIPWLSPRKPPEEHVVLTIGALHHADSAMLRVAASEWHNELASLPKPLLVVNIGGPTRHCSYGEDLAFELVSALKMVLVTCGSVRISFSQRTPFQIADYIWKEMSFHPKVYIWNGQGPNPHLGHLAWGDAFVITADSISMLSEACSTGKPVYVIGGEKCKWKFAAFYKNLCRRGVLRPFMGTEDMSECWSYPPLNDNVEAANCVHKALAKHGWTIDL
eukprot:c26667_g1_i1 orf=414-1763(-)